jgi:long-chain acyl-CoA synthetase
MSFNLAVILNETAQSAPERPVAVYDGGIVSRKKELIIRGGYNVYPSEIENVLHAHPAVAEAAVVGVPDERLDEEVMAVVIRRPAMDLLEAELVSYCRERLAAYKCPRVFQFRSELPKNTLGKVLKDELISGGGPR